MKEYDVTIVNSEGTMMVLTFMGDDIGTVMLDLHSDSILDDIKSISIEEAEE